ncbi:hypothetical protein N8072_01115 [bacterium]|nr:hypothetical protein [bacterium]MDB4128631.1 hypothetical protein [bacterium]MDC1257261.1 hypothetical protein [bacterium]
MTRIAYDSIAKDDFNVKVFYANDISDIADKDELYEAFESGWPVVIKGLTIPGVDYDYYDDLDDWIIEGNKWIMPWYNSHIKNRSRLELERGWNDKEIDVFHKKHKQSNAGWEEVFNAIFPRYDTTAKMLSHRYNMLVENKLHLDELDEDHTGHEQQIRMFVQLDKKRPRVLTFGPDIPQLYEKYKDEFNLDDIDKNDIHKFITEMRNRCVWNDKKWDQFHHPLHYITFDPGDIWFFNAQWITHQIIFGAKLQCYEADIKNESLLDPSKCMAERIKTL